MKNLIILFLLISFTSQATVYYVATDGNDTDDGTTINTPFKTISKACGIATAGDIIYVRGGTYNNSVTIQLNKSGTDNSPITLQNYAGERPLIDFSGTSFGKRGLDLKGNYWKIKGLDICKAGDNGMIISGNYNTVEFCSFFDNKDTGLQLGGGAHDNQIINCDSYWNADPTDYGDADGFAAKLDVGTNNYFYGCRAWLNVDDGWDGYMRGNDDVSTVLENCWTWMNGYFKDGTDGGARANGNGFKMGGSDDKTLKHNFTLRNCVSFNNKAKGFDQNSNAGSMILENCSAYDNKNDNYSIYKALAAGKIASVTNSVNVGGDISFGNFVTETTNSWMIPFTVTKDDFISLDTTGISGPRQADGNLPEVKFLHLQKGSDLIDAGTNVGYSYLGSAPDLGAFEFDATTQTQPLFTENDRVYFSGENLILHLNKAITNPTKFNLYNLKGELILQAQIHSSETIKNCQGLTNGMYLIEVISENNRVINKLIKN